MVFRQMVSWLIILLLSDISPLLFIAGGCPAGGELRTVHVCVRAAVSPCQARYPCASVCALRGS